MLHSNGSPYVLAYKWFWEGVNAPANLFLSISKPIQTATVRFNSLGQSRHRCPPSSPVRAHPLTHRIAVLAKRSFPPPCTARMVETGYRDAPEVDSDMAIVFVKVCGRVCGQCVCQDALLHACLCVCVVWAGRACVRGGA